MSDTEVFGTREADALYSAWHRVKALERFMTHERAWEMGLVDLDRELVLRGMSPGPWVEYCRHTCLPLVFIETALDRGQDHKTFFITEAVAQAANRHALCVLITPTPEHDDIARFRVRKIHSPGESLAEPWERPWTVCTPREYALKLSALRAIAKQQLAASTEEAA